jgi:hypothetical protein
MGGGQWRTGAAEDHRRGQQRTMGGAAVVGVGNRGVGTRMWKWGKLGFFLYIYM